MTALGDLIKTKRLAKKLTQKELAKRAHITRPRLVEWEQGKHKGIRKESLYALEQALGCAPGELYRACFAEEMREEGVIR